MPLSEISKPLGTLRDAGQFIATLPMKGTHRVRIGS
jgi:hypothetical protein